VNHKLPVIQYPPFPTCFMYANIFLVSLFLDTAIYNLYEYVSHTYKKCRRCYQKTKFACTLYFSAAEYCVRDKKWCSDVIYSQSTSFFYRFFFPTYMRFILCDTYGIQLRGTASTSAIEILERFQLKVLCMIVDSLWFVPSTVIWRDLRTPTVKE
jgi:hypothetical protein